MEKPAVLVKRCRWAISAVLAAVAMAVPPLVILLGVRNSGMPGVWIQTAVAGKGKPYSMLAHTQNF
jgi:hypothetical protein